MEMLQGVWKQHLRPRAVVGYSVKILFPPARTFIKKWFGTMNDIVQTQFFPVLQITSPDHLVVITRANG